MSLAAVFGPQWEGFEFEDGRRLYGIGNGVGTPSVTAAVPEPASLALLSLLILALVRLRPATSQSALAAQPSA